MPTFSLTPKGPFALSAALRFLADFTPAAYPPEDDGVLRLAFPADDGLHVVGCAVRQPGDAGDVRVEWSSDGADPAAVRAQVARILSLDVDGSGFPAVGRADSQVGRLQAEFPGLRPVCFYSPYEAAAWTVIGNRLRMTRAAAVKDGLARTYGEALTVAGRERHAFPLPAVLRALDSVPGVSAVKTQRLHALAEAALDGRLDAAALRALPPEDALARLRELPGIGPFSAELILIRGAGHPDVFPRAEHRLHAAMAEAYGRAETPDALAPVAAEWRPYRSWVSLLFRAGAG
ncbi:DNA-3-methyladenine glycosylase 2 family protein [Streptomyces sp. NPDC047046]|uniref:DNA-3-methyladenine glycosylase family protein n=1 Tax=Streptomyces sp. NPDC047046 TaxID=3155378 RepID=UPI0034060A5E